MRCGTIILATSTLPRSWNISCPYLPVAHHQIQERVPVTRDYIPPAAADVRATSSSPLPLSINGGILGYLCEKCVSTTVFAPIPFPTPSASPTVLCRLMNASYSILSSNVASCINRSTPFTPTPLATSMRRVEGRQSPL